VRKASQLVTELSESDGDLTKRINIRIENEVGTLSRGLNLFLGKTHEIVKDTCESLEILRKSAEINSDLSEKTRGSVDKQERDVEEVTSAINEMTRATAEIATNCTDTAKSAQQALGTVTKCASGMDDAVGSLRELTHNMELATQQVDELESATQGISGIVEVISDISEQTNLLALNAAIEAARAGEQGRGFAVVADEVRNLATRTNQSTTEINELIETLAKNSSSAVQAMRVGAKMCNENMKRAASSQAQLREVVETTEQINGAAITIAAAVEEQNVVATEVSRNVNNINDAIHDVSDIAHQTNDESSRIKDVTDILQRKLNQFKY
jgi:methyl-accepting chemotaxis protein